MIKSGLENNSSVTFVGHFDIGESLGGELIRLVEEARSVPGKKIILVGDIGVYDKLYAFIRKGIDGIIFHYHYRQYCAETECLLSQLPANEQAILATFDEDQYNYMASFIQKRHPEVYSRIKSQKEKTPSILQNCDLDELIQSIIELRLRKYNFNDEDVVLISERYLRNLVGRRIKPEGKKSWTQLNAYVKNNDGVWLGNELITSGNNNPLCRGIMFAFNEYLSDQGYTDVHYYLEERQQIFVKKGWDLFNRYKNELNHLNSKVNKIQITTAQNL
jgi:hypothetical protein